MCYDFVSLVTGIARSVNPGQSLRCTNPVSSQSGPIMNNTQVF